MRSALLSLIAFAILLASIGVQAQNRPEKKDPLLSPDDIALIEVYEVNLDSDPPPRVVIPRDEIRKFLKEYQEDDEELRGRSNQESFLRSQGHIQLSKFFEHKARDYYKHVRVRSQIETLREWSNIHRRYVLEYFQPIFGSGAVQGLYLFPKGRDADRIEMTNFYILTQVTIDGKPFIDRNAPEDSLLVQWGLPREEAKFPAPAELEGWQPRFKDTDDKRFTEHVDWISSLITANQGSTYGISFNMPQHKRPRN
ncbi:MAG: hypothetical protein AAGB26_02250 [Planctomycetota bacterium]